MRTVDPSRSIEEYQCRDGQLHGYYRWIMNNGFYQIRYYRDGKEYGEQRTYGSNDQLICHYAVDSDGEEVDLRRGIRYDL